ncbi:TrmB family transcriptional regulator [Sporosarcina sp. 179-K 3D1 HS]|uniref:TrmB family transcriptional regulator n=1 Tax=Sporosarcina sp. 179-K 3D1 HS TaxID=3232169 RepID=UPI0039A1D1DF
MSTETIHVLKDLNFTEYEAKAYLALLEKSPLSGYAISLSSGVPRSKIYEVLAGLVDRGEVMMSHENPVLYSPLPPNELIALRKRKAEVSFDVAEKALEHYSFVSLNRGNIWNISGNEAVVSRAKEVIKHAKERILLEIWKEDAEEIKEELREAHDRGVEILIVSYGEIDFDFGQMYPHDASEEITKEYGGRWIILSADDREVLAGIVSLGENSRAAWTTHPSLVMPITEVIIHDLYIHEMLKEHREILEQSFGPHLIDLRKRFNVGPSGYSIAAKLGLTT